MAEDVGGDALGDAPKVKSLPVKKLILLILLPLLLILGGGAGLFLSGLLGGKSDGQQQAEPEPANMPKKGEAGFYTTLSDFILTPRTVAGESRFVMVTISLHLSAQDQNAIVKAGEARMRDAIIVYLNNQPVESLSQPGNIETLRQGLEAEIRRVTPKLNLYSAQITRLRVQ